jgi:hypothetical protein
MWTFKSDALIVFFLVDGFSPLAFSDSSGCGSSFVSSVYVEGDSGFVLELSKGHVLPYVLSLVASSNFSIFSNFIHKGAAK